MLNQFSRAQSLPGVPAMKKLRTSHAAIFGPGGMGGYVAEALARSDISTLGLIDDDKVCLTNLDHQVLALCSTVGGYEVEVAAARVTETNLGCRVTVYRMFYLPETTDRFDFHDYDYIIDTIDTMTDKIQLVLQAKEADTKIINCTGAGNKLDPTKSTTADIYKISVDPLACVTRRKLKKRSIWKCKMVHSTEAPARPLEDPNISCRNHYACPPGTEWKHTERRNIPGGATFVPAVVELVLAGEVVRELAGKGEVQVSFDFAGEKS